MISRKSSKSWLTRAFGAGPEAVCRVLLALGGAVALHLDPPDFSILPAATVPLALAFFAYAVWLLGRDLQRQSALAVIPWCDLGWGLALTAVTGGTSSVLFFLLMLPIFSRAFGGGFDAGWRMTLAGTGGFLLVGLPASPGGVLFEFNRALIRPLVLLLLGYMLAREGGEQKRARRRLALLAQLNTIANPRFGVDRTLLNAAQCIRSVYAGRQCIILLTREDDPATLVARASDEELRIEKLPAAAAYPLLALPDGACLIHGPRRFACSGADTEDLAERGHGVADLLDTPSLLTVPMARGDQMIGRIYVCDAVLPQFDAAELDFLASAAAHLLNVLDKVDLVDRLATLAAASERKRLANDLHDLAIQPYLGVQMGIAAALSRHDCPPAVAADLRDLQQLAQQGAHELRLMLKGQRAGQIGGDLVREAIARLQHQYAGQCGIEIELDYPQDLHLSDRLASEVVALVSEGISNVRRHTESRWARIRLTADATSLRVQVENATDMAAATDFVPKSLRARTLALGGALRIERTLQGDTAVIATIPM